MDIAEFQAETIGRVRGLSRFHPIGAIKLERLLQCIAAYLGIANTPVEAANASFETRHKLVVDRLRLISDAAEKLRTAAENIVVFCHGVNFSCNEVSRLCIEPSKICDATYLDAFAKEFWRLVEHMEDQPMPLANTHATSGVDNAPAGQRVITESTILLAEFRDSIGVSQTTFSKYATEAGVINERGRRDRRLTTEERTKILDWFIKACPTAATKDKCIQLRKSLLNH